MYFSLKCLYTILINFVFGFVFALFIGFFSIKLACLDGNVNYFWALISRQVRDSTFSVGTK